MSLTPLMIHCIKSDWVPYRSAASQLAIADQEQHRSATPEPHVHYMASCGCNSPPHTPPTDMYTVTHQTLIWGRA